MTDNDFADLFANEADYDTHLMTFVRLKTNITNVLGVVLLMFSYNPQLREVETAFVELERSY